MNRTKASAIVNDFFADMNPSLWNGSTSMPKSFLYIMKKMDGAIIVIWSINLMTAHLIC